MTSKLCAVIGVLAVITACAPTQKTPDFGWPADRDAVPDAHTAIMISLAVFQGMIRRDIGNPAQLATELQATLHSDPDGVAWVVAPTPEEDARFNKMCNNCSGGELFIMTIAKHDGRVLEVYVPQ